MNFFKKMMPLALIMVVMAGSVYAQGTKVKSKDISDQELQTFVKMAGQVQQIQREAQMKMQKVISDEGIKPQRFQTIMMSKKNPKMADSVDVTEEEEKAFENIKPKMAKLNQKMMKKYQGLFSDNDISQQRFRQIAQAMQSNQKLQQRFQKMQAKQMKMRSDSSDDNG